MVQVSTRLVRCRVTITVDSLSQDYFVGRTADSWTFAKVGGSSDGMFYTIRSITSQSSVPTLSRLQCDCRGYQRYSHCKHADWLRFMGVGFTEAQAEDFGRKLADGELHRFNHAQAVDREEMLRQDIAERWAEINVLAAALDEESRRADELMSTVEMKIRLIDELRGQFAELQPVQVIPGIVVEQLTRMDLEEVHVEVKSRARKPAKKVRRPSVAKA